ncbi:hypothetical protein HYH03_015231 [Edaphochlamys debaryana]|uniref:Uncharacterized protein n=1 Tax=Edaphochlamys debaryana TaxID=47281 RepID=A0A835XL89_9CHLO|nr:hypothetical protein HYH03_015231 [Edaphochlamys debaryana]|eukprot:KAG2486138.1 hypothetical protein HYH03_015231 [Edaphochlamys debaryana]
MAAALRRAAPPSAAATGTTTLLQPAKANLAVAFDVGTYGSGFAYMLVHPQAGGPGAGGVGGAGGLRLHTAWPDAPSGSTYPKTRSALLLKGNRGVAIGWSAVRQYDDLNPEEREEGRYCLVYGEAFKLGLQDPRRAEGQLPPGVGPELAFSEFLRLLKAYTLRHLSRELPPGSPAAAAAAGGARAGMVVWALTVPALWSDGAKAAVRRAAFTAGLIPREDSEQLVIVLEPEAAALHCALGPERPRLVPAGLGSPAAHAAAAAAAAAAGSAPPPPLRAGEVVVVVDAGGGTVDVTVHTVEERGGVAVLSEAPAVEGRGEMWGATQVDAAFEAWFRERVGDVFDAWRLAHPGEWTDLVMNHWEPVKCRYAGPEAAAAAAPAGPAEAVGAGAGGEEDEEEDGWAGGVSGRGVRIPVVPTLHVILEEGTKADLTMEYGSSDSVVLDGRTLERLFRDPVAGVVAVAQAQLAALAASPSAPSSRPSKVLVVGGFGCSPYLQSRLASALGGRLAAGGAVLLPENPAAVVLQGAAQYGLHPELIRARASRLTYGVRTAVPYEDGMPGRFWHPSECCFYSSAGFSPFVSRGQLVQAEEVVTHVFTPLSPDQQIAAVELWATDQASVPFIPAEAALGGGAGGEAGGGGAMRRVGEVQVVLLREGGPSTGGVPLQRLAGPPAEEEEAERLIEVSLAFGRTEIKVAAKDLATGRVVSTKAKFAYSIGGFGPDSPPPPPSLLGGCAAEAGAGAGDGPASGPNAAAVRGDDLVSPLTSPATAAAPAKTAAAHPRGGSSTGGSTAKPAATSPATTSPGAAATSPGATPKAAAAQEAAAPEEAAAKGKEKERAMGDAAACVFIPPPASLRVAAGGRGSGLMAEVELAAAFPVGAGVAWELIKHPGKAGAFREVKEILHRAELSGGGGEGEGEGEGGGHSKPGVRVYEETQVGSMQIMWHHTTFHSRVRVEEEDAVRQMRFRLVRGDTLDRFEGCWTVTPTTREQALGAAAAGSGGGGGGGGGSQAVAAGKAPAGTKPAGAAGAAATEAAAAAEAEATEEEEAPVLIEREDSGVSGGGGGGGGGLAAAGMRASVSSGDGGWEEVAAAEGDSAKSLGGGGSPAAAAAAAPTVRAVAASPATSAGGAAADVTGGTAGAADDGADGAGGSGAGGGEWCIVTLKQGLMPKGIPALLRPAVGGMVRSATEGAVRRIHEDLSSMVAKIVEGLSVDDAICAVRAEHQRRTGTAGGHAHAHGHGHGHGQAPPSAAPGGAASATSGAGDGKEHGGRVVAAAPAPAGPTAAAAAARREPPGLGEAAADARSTREALAARRSAEGHSLAKAAAEVEADAGAPPRVRNAQTGEVVYSWVP